MRKPISKQALRRALEQVRTDGEIRWDEPTGAVVDKIWHELGRRAYGEKRKKPTAEPDTIRTMPPVDTLPAEPDEALREEGVS